MLGFCFEMKGLFAGFIKEYSRSRGRSYQKTSWFISAFTKDKKLRPVAYFMKKMLFFEVRLIFMKVPRDRRGRHVVKVI